MPNGTATVSFGTYPGAIEAELDVTGQTGLISTSRIEAWVMPIATADHSADEHVVEAVKVAGVYKSANVLTVKARVDPWIGGPATFVQAQRLHGNFSIGWAWSN